MLAQPLTLPHVTWIATVWSAAVLCLRLVKGGLRQRVDLKHRTEFGALEAGYERSGARLALREHDVSLSDFAIPTGEDASLQFCVVGGVNRRYSRGHPCLACAPPVAPTHQGLADVHRLSLPQ